jgi:hypothetical protein
LPGQEGGANMRIETEDLIIRNFELADENDLCEYMMQRVHAQFESYPNFTPEKAREEIMSRSKSDEFFAIELKKSYTIVIVTHNMQQAVRISDNTAFFLLGDLIEYGNTERMFENPHEKKTEDYITGRFG